MTVSFILSSEPPMVCMFDDRNDLAFGPVVHGDDCMEVLADFLNNLNDDPRALPDYELAFAWAGYTATRTIPNPADLVGAEAGNPPDDGSAGTSPSAFGDFTPGPLDPNTPVLPSTEKPTEDPFQPPNPSPSEGGTPSSPVPSGERSEPAPIADSAIPLGRRRCWSCSGARVEPERPGEPCGICVGKGHLPI